MPYGLPDQSLQQLRELFARQQKVQRVVLYGSRAKGNYRPGSDIDLTLEGDDLSLQDLNRMEQQLDDLLLPWAIDLSLFADIDNPDLIDHIRRVGQILFERAPSYSESPLVQCARLMADMHCRFGRRLIAYCCSNIRITLLFRRSCGSADPFSAITTNNQDLSCSNPLFPLACPSP